MRELLVASASLGAGAVCAPVLLRALSRRGQVLPNHRGALLPTPAGLLVPLVALPLLGASAVVASVEGARSGPPGWLPAALWVVGVCGLGLLDDLGKGEGHEPRGLRGHARALRAGRPSAGILKAAGSVLLAALVLSTPLPGTGAAGGALLVSLGTLVLSAHVFNLLDLRPGRSLKALLVVAAVLVAAAEGARALPLLAVFLGPLLVLLAVDLRERGMLGDAGAGTAGAVAGLWLVVALPGPGEAVALVVLGGVTAYGEVRSITSLVERVPVLRRLDELGRRAPVGAETRH